MIDETLFPKYLAKVRDTLKSTYKNYNFKSVDLSFLINASSVFSSNIEGNSVDLNSFMNYKMSAGKIKPKKEICEIEDLIRAYEFAGENELNEKNLLKAHKILSKRFVGVSRRGVYRKEKIGVFGRSGLIYLAAPQEILKKEMKIFWGRIEDLLKKKLTLEEVFYFAAQIHLAFAHIHPFVDGNGRAVRLLEKWFLAKKLGENAWKISSEEFYFKNRPKYYKNLNLGVNYFELDYSKALPFLVMLPKALAL